jgi:hypothetical protein
MGHTVPAKVLACMERRRPQASKESLTNHAVSFFVDRSRPPSTRLACWAPMITCLSVMQALGYRVRMHTKTWRLGNYHLAVRSLPALTFNAGRGCEDNQWLPGKHPLGQTHEFLNKCPGSPAIEASR